MIRRDPPSPAPPIPLPDRVHQGWERFFGPGWSSHTRRVPIGLAPMHPGRPRMLHRERLRTHNEVN